MPGPKPQPIADRLWARVNRGPDCWEWTGPRDKDGYGYFSRGPARFAHRVAWVVTNGPVPSGLVVRHACDNPACVRPDHLLLGTQAENLQDCRDRGRAVTVRGEQHGHHKLTDKQVASIRHLALGGFTRRAIADVYDVNPATVTRIVNFDRRCHVTSPS